jgi:hypothetical protein
MRRSKLDRSILAEGARVLKELAESVKYMNNRPGNCGY